MKNIYIATSGEIKHKAQELCTLLEKHGFNVTFKWWLSYTQNGNNEYHQMSPKQFKEIDKIQLIGEIDLMAIEKSDWLILINDKNITPRGSFIEAGYALGKGKRVICIGDLPKSAMVSRFIHFKDINDFIFTLNNED